MKTTWQIRISRLHQGITTAYVMQDFLAYRVFINELIQQAPGIGYATERNINWQRDHLEAK